MKSLIEFSLKSLGITAGGQPEIQTGINEILYLYVIVNPPSVRAKSPAPSTSVTATIIRLPF